MDDEMKLRRALERASKAEQLLENETFKGAFAELEAMYLQAWRNTSVSETGQYEREKLWLAINILGKVKDHVGMLVRNGKLARADLEMREKRSTRAA